MIHIKQNQKEETEHPILLPVKGHTDFCITLQKVQQF